MIKAIVTDIEGTTTALSFVKDVLFPYARSQIAEFVRHNQDDPRIAGLLQDARSIAGADLTDEQLIAVLEGWIDNDEKITPLKSLQGLIWYDGYHKGRFKGHVYQDAARNLSQWHAQGFKLYVYSSGSVQAQKLLFAQSDYGDLSVLFSGYFDTHIGGKRETASYQAIAAELGLPGEDILFLSDIVEELDAAKAAGFATCWLVRGQTIDANAAHRQVENFDQIILNA
ncbi:MAG: acireductone synthase [Methylobacter sp.]|nr:MAG: acireductone synthase [Methylobacter sp.]PPD22162.1 MAG: acireductone synthase [Methylobacter sp.]PPD35328.1 MAG: acireductone synthase [Methylomonas sp.]